MLEIGSTTESLFSLNPGSVSVIVPYTEFVSPLDTPKNLIMLGVLGTTKKKNVSDDIERNFDVSPILKKLIF